MERQIRYQRDIEVNWTTAIATRPGLDRLYSCIQCGTCSGTCPLSLYMDLTPRRIIAMVREGFRDDVLRSQTIWLCSSCYSCAVHCPQDIHITDIMYALKREAIREKLWPRRFPIPVLAREFYRMVKKKGRSSEFRLAARLMLKTNPFSVFKMAGSGIKLLRAGRLPLFCEQIEAKSSLRAALPAPEKEI